MSRYAAVADTRVAVSELSPEIGVLTLIGDHDMASEDLLTETLGALIGDGVNVLIDLSDTSFIDCSIVRVIDAAIANATRHGVRIAVLLHTRPIVERVVNLTRAKDRWPLYTDFDAAISSFVHRKSGL